MRNSSLIWSSSRVPDLYIHFCLPTRWAYQTPQIAKRSFNFPLQTYSGTLALHPLLRKERQQHPAVIQAKSLALTLDSLWSLPPRSTPHPNSQQALLPLAAHLARIHLLLSTTLTLVEANWCLSRLCQSPLLHSLPDPTLVKWDSAGNLLSKALGTRFSVNVNY